MKHLAFTQYKTFNMFAIYILNMLAISVAFDSMCDLTEAILQFSCESIRIKISIAKFQSKVKQRLILIHNVKIIFEFKKI